MILKHRLRKRDDAELVCCSKSKLMKRNNQVKILEMHFGVYSNFSSLGLVSKKKGEEKKLKHSLKIVFWRQKPDSITLA